MDLNNAVVAILVLELVIGLWYIFKARGRLRHYRELDQMLLQWLWMGMLGGIVACTAVVLGFLASVVS